MNKRTHSLRDRLSELEMQPSPVVWEKIAAANPQPVVKPLGGKWMKFTVGAAVLTVAGLLLWLLPIAPSDKVVDADTVDTVHNEMQLAHLPKDYDKINHQPPSHPNTASSPCETPSPQNISTQPVQEELPQGKAAMNPVTKPILPSFAPVNPTIKTIPLPAEDFPGKNIPATTPPEVQQPPTEPESIPVAGKTETPVTIELFVPNAFNPNGDGVNDVFSPVAKNNASVFDYKLQIYSRAGKLLFESIHIETGWDGTFQGLPYGESVCIYIITFRDSEGNPYSEKGTLTIIR